MVPQNHHRRRPPHQRLGQRLPGHRLDRRAHARQESPQRPAAGKRDVANPGARPDDESVVSEFEGEGDGGMTSKLFTAIVICLAMAMQLGAAEPLSLHPDNPHYFLFRGNPAVLITSGEHYGAVLNPDFDYSKYLDELAAYGLNNTRTFSGAYVEPNGAFNIARNMLAPKGDRFLCPWARSNQPGYAGGGNKFDLAKWDAAYFKRLKDFVGQAGKRGIVVEMNLFCPMYDDAQWKLSPMNEANNVSGVGKIGKGDVYTLDKNGKLLDVQEKMVRKIVADLAQFDNLYYEVCNE